MRAVTLALLAICALALVPPAGAQQQGGLPRFDSADAMRGELDRLVRDRDFVALVERFSPPALMSMGRVRVLEERYKATLDPFGDSGHLILETPAEGVTREVIAYWAGDVYAYVYLLTHAREDGIRVLDFQISGDVRAIKDWW